MTFEPVAEFAGLRILVTGASGFLGRALCRVLTQRGASVHGLSRADRSRSATGMRWHQADMEKPSELERVWSLVQPDVVYHLSGAVNGAPDLALLLPTYHSLLTTTVNLLEIATRRRCRRLVLASSLEEVDAEDDDAPPVSPYAAAKTAAHEYARMCHALFGTHAVNLRTFMTYGPGQPDWKLIPSVMRALFEGTSPDLSSGQRRIDWVYIDDVAEAFAAAAVAPQVDGQTIDVGSGRLASIREVVEGLAARIAPQTVLRFGVLPDRPERPPRVADPTAAGVKLGWAPRTSLEEGLSLTVEHCRATRPRPR